MIPRVRSQYRHHYNPAHKLNLELFCSTASQKIKIADEVEPLTHQYGKTTNSTPNGQIIEPKDVSPHNALPSPSFLRVNVGGRSAHISVESIRQRLDNSRLALFCEKTHVERLTDCDAYFDHSQEYYFEKSPTIFEYIIDYYITGKLHRPVEICPIRLRDELEFWRIPATALAECCKFDDLLGFGGMKSAKHGLAHFTNEQIYLESSCPPALFDNVVLGKIRLILWTFLENPRSSIPAKILSILSATFVLLSLAGLILSSMPEFQRRNANDEVEPLWYIQTLEICCMVFFSVEYLTRLLVNPKKCDFIKQPLNVIDLLTIIPFFVEECLPLLGIYDIELRNLRGAMIVMRVMRLARVARIFKLARYSIGLRAFGETMRKSAAELSMLGMFLLTGIMLFSTAIYFFERDEVNSKFYSIPSAWWWCVATMTTVGYGDLVPVTTGGKIVAAMASVCGIIVLAFPISMIIDKFAESTGEWRGEQFFPKNRAGSAPSTNRSSDLSGGGRVTKRTKSRRYLF
ncbi:ion transport protein domain-containing protein [Ditylenchus destructor]|uniref:Ion transport protein domain-containing protein n=1 Tax=Ditylenchus destructor TaxID=166010 RepID=A0AAD4RA42_9BILA|nr:ion transport protein domain-containing protein [Ditylenchus destructor]